MQLIRIKTRRQPSSRAPAFSQMKAPLLVTNLGLWFWIPQPMLTHRLPWTAESGGARGGGGQ